MTRRSPSAPSPEGTDDISAQATDKDSALNIMRLGARDGLEAAQACGQRLGRPPAMDADQVRRASSYGRPNNPAASTTATVYGVDAPEGGKCPFLIR